MTSLHDLSHQNEYLEDVQRHAMIRARIQYRVTGAGKEREQVADLFKHDGKLTVFEWFASSALFFHSRLRRLSWNGRRALMLHVKTNELGELYVATPRRQYEVTAKRQQAEQARSMAAQYRRWAEQEESIARQADEIADAWQKEII